MHMFIYMGLLMRVGTYTVRMGGRRRQNQWRWSGDGDRHSGMDWGWAGERTSEDGWGWGQFDVSVHLSSVDGSWIFWFACSVQSPSSDSWAGWWNHLQAWTSTCTAMSCCWNATTDVRQSTVVYVFISGGSRPGHGDASAFSLFVQPPSFSTDYLL